MNRMWIVFRQSDVSQIDEENKINVIVVAYRQKLLKKRRGGCTAA